MYNQLYDYFDNILFLIQCGLPKGLSTQHCLSVIIEKFKQAIDRRIEFGVFIIDLSKAFDCVNHPPVTAKIYS